MAEAPENPLYGKATDAFIQLERAMVNLFGATGNGLGEKARSVEGKISRRSFNNLMSISRVRNKIAHEEGSKTKRNLADIIVDCDAVLARLRSEAALQGATKPELRPAVANWRSTANNERVRPRGPMRGNSGNAEGAYTRPAYGPSPQTSRKQTPSGRFNAEPHGVEVAFKYLLWSIAVVVAIVASTKVLGMLEGSSAPDLGPRVAQPESVVTPEVSPDWLPTPQADDAGSADSVVGLDVTPPVHQEDPVDPAEPVAGTKQITDAQQIPVLETEGARAPVAIAITPDEPHATFEQSDRQPQTMPSPPTAPMVSPEDRFRQLPRSSVTRSDESRVSPEDRFRQNR